MSVLIDKLAAWQNARHHPDKSRRDDAARLVELEGLLVEIAAAVSGLAGATADAVAADYPHGGGPCALCGRDPAAGFASIGDKWYCHGDDDPSPTCYMRAPWPSAAASVSGTGGGPASPQGGAVPSPPSRVVSETDTRTEPLPDDSCESRLALATEALTAANDGDSIHKFYSDKLWRSLTYWKERFETAERAASELDTLREALREARQALAPLVNDPEGLDIGWHERARIVAKVDGILAREALRAASPGPEQHFCPHCDAGLLTGCTCPDSRLHSGPDSTEEPT